MLIPGWWRRRVLPPGPIGLLRRPFIAIAGSRRHPLYKPARAALKGPAKAPASLRIRRRRLLLWSRPRPYFALRAPLWIFAAAAPGLPGVMGWVVPLRIASRRPSNCATDQACAN